MHTLSLRKYKWPIDDLRMNSQGREMIWIVLVSLHLLVPSIKAQTAKDALRVAGTWSLDFSSKKQGGEKQKMNVEFRVENDSLVLMVANELGNMEKAPDSYPIVPKQSGPKGMDFETVTIKVDEVGDTLRTTESLRFRDLDKMTISGSWGAYTSCVPKGWTTADKDWCRTRQMSKSDGFTIYFSGRRSK